VISFVLSERSVILIVVEPSNTQNLLLDYLKGSGFKVLVATDGKNALEVVQKTPPDIILLDVVLPGIDGFETCRRLKANSRTRDIPVIFIASQTNTVDKVRGFVLGAVDYISKPLHSEEVLARLKTHLTLQKLQNDLEARNARLHDEIAEREKLIEELDAFAHTVAHDLKNPLGVTITQAQFLRKFHARMPMEEFEDNLDLIVRNGHKMNNIIYELLLLSSVRVEDVDLEPLDMATIVSEAVNRLSFLIEENDAEMFIPVPPKWPVVTGYGPWVEEVWINYISNAIKYGGPSPCVALGAIEQENGMVQFWVKDSGQGLAQRDQDKLFFPFYRLNQVRVEGHGLGLSIVRRIMNKLSGSVSVSSKIGEGSVFSFYLPLA